MSYRVPTDPENPLDLFQTRFLRKCDFCHQLTPLLCVSERFWLRAVLGENGHSSCSPQGSSLMEPQVTKPARGHKVSETPQFTLRSQSATTKRPSMGLKNSKGITRLERLKTTRPRQDRVLNVSYTNYSHVFSFKLHL